MTGGPQQMTHDERWTLAVQIAGQLRDGALDATVLGILPARQFRLAEGVAPYCLMTGRASVTMHPMRTYMKWESWRKLPAEYRAVIDGLGPAGADCWFARESGIDADAHFESALEEFDLTVFTDARVAEVRDIIRPEVDAVLDAVEDRGLPGRRFYARMTQLAAEYDA